MIQLEYQPLARSSPSPSPSPFFYSIPFHTILYSWVSQDLKAPFKLGSTKRANKLTSSCLQKCAANLAQAVLRRDCRASSVQSYKVSLHVWTRSDLGVHHRALCHPGICKPLDTRQVVALTCSVQWDDEAKAGRRQNNSVLRHIHSQLFSCADSSPSARYTLHVCIST